MDQTSRLQLVNWIVSQGLTGMPEADLVRGFCERCRAGGVDVSRGLIFTDRLHPIFEGRGFRWNDTEVDESEIFEYGSSEQGAAAENWHRSVFFHMLENGHSEFPINLADGSASDFSIIGDLAARGHRHAVA